MKKTSRRPTGVWTVTGPRRLGVAEAKTRFSEVLRSLEEAPVVIHSRGHDVGVLVGIETYNRFAAAPRPRAGGAAFLASVAELRDRIGGVSGFDPAPADLNPQKPFSARRRR